MICLILYACTTPEVGTPKLPELISNFKVKITSNAYLVLDELNKALAPEDSLEFIAEENNLSMLLQKESAENLNSFGEIKITDRSPRINEIGQFKIDFDGSSTTNFKFGETQIIDTTAFPNPDTLHFSYPIGSMQTIFFTSDTVLNIFEDFDKIVIDSSSVLDTLKVVNNYGNPVSNLKISFISIDANGDSVSLIFSETFTQKINPNSTATKLIRIANVAMTKRYAIRIQGNYIDENTLTYGQEKNNVLKISLIQENTYYSSEIQNVLFDGEDEIQIKTIKDSILIYQSNIPIDPENPNANAMILKAAFFDTLKIPLKFSVSPNLINVLREDSTLIVKFEEIYTRPDLTWDHLKIVNTSIPASFKFSRNIQKTEINSGTGGKVVEIDLVNSIMRFINPPLFSQPNKNQSLFFTVDYKLKDLDGQRISLKATDGATNQIAGDAAAVYSEDSFLEGRVKNYIDSTVANYEINYPEDIYDKGLEFTTTDVILELELENTRTKGYADLIATGIKTLPNGTVEKTSTKNDPSLTRVYVQPHPYENKSYGKKEIKNWEDLAKIISKFPKTLQITANYTIGYADNGDLLVVSGETIPSKAKISLSIPMKFKLAKNFFFDELNINNNGTYTELDFDGDKFPEFMNRNLENLKLAIEVKNSLPLQADLYILMDTSLTDLNKIYTDFRHLDSLSNSTQGNANFIAFLDSLDAINKAKYIFKVSEQVVLKDTLALNGIKIPTNDNYNKFYYPPFTNTKDEINKVFVYATPKIFSSNGKVVTMDKNTSMNISIDLLMDLKLDRNIDN
ncbi:hypothetical protein IT568_04560 [bacterium]|nr:hypothetical protein [bacterium]